MPDVNQMYHVSSSLSVGLHDLPATAVAGMSVPLVRPTTSSRRSRLATRRKQRVTSSALLGAFGQYIGF